MTARLSQYAVTHWETLDGFAVSQGLEPLDQLTPDRFCNFVWWWLTRGDDGSPESQRQVERMRLDLWRPPRGETVVPAASPWSTESELQAFNDLRAQLGA